MIKFTAGALNGRTLVGLGLSFGNLAKFRDYPMDTFIMVKGEEIGIQVDIMIFSGETEEDMKDKLSQFISSDTDIKGFTQ